MKKYINFNIPLEGFYDAKYSHEKQAENATDSASLMDL